MPPDSSAKSGSRPPNPGDATDALVARMRSGDLSEVIEADEIEQATIRIPAVPTPEYDIPDSPIVTVREAGIRIPPVLVQLLGTEAESELLAVAKCLSDRTRKKLTLVFHTPIGDVKSPVAWSSAEPMHLHRVKHLLLIMVRSSESMFAPHPGSELEISFLEHRDSPRVRVLCLAPPMQLYPGVGIDLLCFLPQSASVEKQGVLHDGVPSVVSGRPSDRVDDETGEPIAEGEKSASARFPEVGKSVANVAGAARLDFDRPRAN
jgi:hypothetical protein